MPIQIRPESYPLSDFDYRLTFHYLKYEPVWPQPVQCETPQS